MGKVLSLMGRPLRNYNIENRAHKIISKEKPTPAPKHKSDQIDYERMMKEYPEAFEESQQKHEQLNKYLKDVYVQSHDPVSGKICILQKTAVIPDSNIKTKK
jgi:NADH dehydrogenase [ubiquinone] 1 alpha subcomplex assembly factor 4